MNQTFNIKRFGRYTRFILLLNRWYYGVLLVLCVIPTAVLSILGQADFARGLLFFPIVFTIFFPSVDNSYKNGYTSRELRLPASWFEKLIITLALHHWVLVLPFCIHAAAVAFGANGLTSYFADGFEIESVLESLMLINYGMLAILASDSSWVWNGWDLFDSKGSGKEKRMVFVALYFAFLIGYIQTHGTPFIPTYVSLPIITIMFATTLVFYRKRHA